MDIRVANKRADCSLDVRYCSKLRPLAGNRYCGPVFVRFTSEVYHMRFKAVVCMLAAIVLCGNPAQADNDSLLQALASGNHFALMRHALAPGNGDPSNFQVEDCSTQRNLNDAGRQQAAAIGKYLRSATMQSPGVYSSQWCRCLETARLLEMGEVTPLPAINSFYATRDRADSQTQATREWLTEAELPVILVTHQVNITALTGIYPASGEIVVVERKANGEFEVAGSLEL